MGKTAGVVLFAILTFAIIICSLGITQGYISDTNASTYVIVPMIMLPVFAVFMLKEKKIVPNVDANSVVFGIVLFALFIALELNALGYLGAEFFAYRIDMLLVPIGLIAIASMIFGLENLDKFAWIAIYALFASPVLLMPIINLNLSFASANSIAIFQLLKPVFSGMTFVGPITVYLNGHGVSIGNTCIGIGALIGLAMFLLPVAYFMDGKPRDKLVWVLSAVGLMLLLNFLRMLIITVSWFAYGPSSVILAVHSVVGQLIFYAVIIIMLLLHGKYVLSYPEIGIGKEKYDYNGRAIFVAAAFSILYLFLSLNYLNASQQALASIPQTATFSKSSIISLYGSYVSAAYNDSTALSALGAGNRSIGLTLQNATANGMPILIIFAMPGSGGESGMVFNSSVSWNIAMEFADAKLRLRFIIGIRSTGDANNA